MNEVTIQHDTAIKAFILLIIIFLEGLVSISVEILAIRQLIPFVGNNVIVTSLIIGVFLLFLAIGYRRGGSRHTDFNSLLKANFTWAALFIGVGMSYTFTTFFFLVLSSHVTHFILFNLTLYLLIVIAPIVYFLGQTIPITTNLVKREQLIGAISGKVLFLSTLGSFLGAVITSLVLLNFLGVGKTIFFNSFLLILLIGLLSDFNLTDIFRIAMLAVALSFIHFINIQMENKIFVKTNNYSNYNVRESYQYSPDNFGKLLDINNTAASFINDKMKALSYVESIKKIIFHDLQLHHKKILVLGSGGFTFSAEGAYSNQILYVDIDSDIKKVVKKHFLKKINGQFIAADARVFLTNKQAQFDAIISDTYNSPTIIPAYLLTKEHMMNIRNALVPGGIAIFNIIANPFLTDPYSKHVDNTIQSVFRSCMKQPKEFKNHYTNIIYVCNKNDRQADKQVYTDDLNRATLEFSSRTSS